MSKFKVGDFVVAKDLIHCKTPSSLRKVRYAFASREYLEVISVSKKTLKPCGNTSIVLCDVYRHANPEEIKAGRRLP